VGTSRTNPPARFNTKTEWIHAQLRDEIASGRFAAGSRLRLTHLAERFGTSEIPVREALRMLQQEGLVAIESHRGATVANVSGEQLLEAIVIRTYLEILALTEATPLHSDQTLAGVRSVLGRMDELAAQGTSKAATRFSEMNREFHRRLYEPCPYPLLRVQINDLWDQVWRTRSRSLFLVQPEHMVRVQAEHRAIADAVEAGDVTGAETVAKQHRASNIQAWRRIIDSSDDTPGDPAPQPQRATS
jgi:DNA-binding GntR family transcriptional regulator